jgi:calcium-dependent protein kinase
MGSICSGRENVEFTDAPKKLVAHNHLVTKNDLKFNASMFVQENYQRFDEVYQLHDSPLGSGAYGEVWLGNHKQTQELRAIKILLKDGMPREEIEDRTVFNEVEILKNLDHPRILKVYEYFEDDLKYYIVIEYCKGGDLFDKISKLKKLTEKQAAIVLKQLLLALNYLHGKKILHRDVKPENLLLCQTDDPEELSVKLIDFGISALKRKNLEKAGTIDYMAPEVFKGNYDEKCDIWGAGVVLYAMVSGFLPFSGSDDEEVQSNILKGKFNIEEGPWATVSKACKDLVKKLLTINPKSRITGEEALNHSWILSFTNSGVNENDYKNTLNRMKTMTKDSKLKEVFTTFIVSQISKNSSNKKLEQIFSRIDINKDGVISITELANELKKEMSSEEAELEAKKIVESIDVDGSGLIDYSEFLRVTTEKESLLSRENIKKAFAFFDKDRSGSIEKEELTKWLSSDGIIPENILNDILIEADSNSDGKIDLSEFEEFLAEKLELE